MLKYLYFLGVGFFSGLICISIVLRVWGVVWMRVLYHGGLFILCLLSYKQMKKELDSDLNTIFHKIVYQLICIILLLGNLFGCIIWDIYLYSSILCYLLLMTLYSSPYILYQLLKENS